MLCLRCPVGSGISFAEMGKLDHKALGTAVPSGTSLKPFLALGAGNDNFSLMARDADCLAAAGADKITVLAVLEAVQQQHKAPVFLIALVDIPGEAAPDCQEHQRIAQQPCNPRARTAAQERGKQAGSKADAENHHVQPVRSISTSHETPEAGCHFLKKLLHLVSEIVHTITQTEPVNVHRRIISARRYAGDVLFIILHFVPIATTGCNF